MLCERLRILLDKLKLNQIQFAEKIGLSQGYVSDILSGKKIPSERVLRLIVLICNVNLKWMETGSGEMFISESVSKARNEIFDALETLDEDQLNLVLGYIEYIKSH